MVTIAIVGYGYWGPQLTRIFLTTPGFKVLSVCEIRREQLAQVHSQYPDLEITTSYQDIITNTAIDAIAIATPASTHYDLALRSLQAGKHVLVEKPMTTNTDHALRLVEEANKVGKVLMVNHTFIFSDAVRKLKDAIKKDMLGELYYYDSVRANLGLFRRDVNVIWDLAVHDLAILDYLFTADPQTVATTSASHISGQQENFANLVCFFDNHLVANIHVNWLSPIKIRRIFIGGSKFLTVYDDLEPNNKLKYYDKGVDIVTKQDNHSQSILAYRNNNTPKIPNLNTFESLKVMAQHFLSSIQGKHPPITDGEMGLRVVRILETADLSSKQGGQPIRIR